MSMLDNVWMSAQGNLSQLRERTSELQRQGINLALALVGVGVYLLGSGWVEYVGVVWAVLNAAPIVMWVLRG